MKKNCYGGSSDEQVLFILKGAVRNPHPGAILPHSKTAIA